MITVLNFAVRARFLIALAVVTILALGTSTASATHNASNQRHWHSETLDYKFHSSFPSNWQDDVNRAADAWTEQTFVTIQEYSLSNNTIEYVAIPEGWDPCTPETTAACTEVIRALGDEHITVTRTIFKAMFPSTHVA